RLLVVIRSNAARAGRRVGEGPGTMNILAGDVFADHERIARSVCDIPDLVLVTKVRAEEEPVAVVEPVVRAVNRALVEPATIRGDEGRRPGIGGGIQAGVRVPAPVGSADTFVIGEADGHGHEVGAIGFRPGIAVAVAGTEKGFDLRGAEVPGA